MKIALVGTGDHWVKAPFGDAEWDIWATGPAIHADIPRCDLWFEIHGDDRFVPILAENPSYAAFLATEKPCQIVMSYDRPGFHDVIEYPRHEMFERFGRDVFTSSPAYMLAWAITKKPDVIGLYGFDMVAAEEYRLQRPAMRELVRIAEREGIKIVTPPECRLFIDPTPYGEPSDPVEAAVMKRLKTLRKRLARRRQEHEEITRAIHQIEGAIAAHEETLSADFLTNLEYVRG